MNRVSRLFRLLPLMLLLVLVTGMVLAPRPAAPSRMELQLQQAMPFGVTPEDFCGMETGSADPCLFCLPQMPWSLPAPPGGFSGQSLRLLEQVAAAVPPVVRRLRTTGPGAIRDPPAVPQDS